MRKQILICLFSILALGSGAFAESNSVAILIHGCHLQTKNWEGIEFGEGIRAGRVTTGLDEALKKKAEWILWGSGASQTKEGLKESEFTFLQATKTHLNGLAKSFHLDPLALEAHLKKVSFLQLNEKNTSEEIRSALNFCVEKNIKNLILISSPTHIARCLQESCKLKLKEEYRGIHVYARSSDVCFDCTTPEDVVIVEPPHRMDRPQIPLHLLVKKILSFVKEMETYSDLVQWLEERENKLP